MWASIGCNEASGDNTMTPKERLEEATEALLRAAMSFGWNARDLPSVKHTFHPKYRRPTMLSDLTGTTVDLVRLARRAFEYHQAFRADIVDRYDV